MSRFLLCTFSIGLAPLREMPLLDLVFMQRSQADTKGAKEFC